MESIPCPKKDSNRRIHFSLIQCFLMNGINFAFTLIYTRRDASGDSSLCTSTAFKVFFFFFS